MNIGSTKVTLGALVAAGKVQVASDTDKGMFDRIKNISFTAEDVSANAEYIKVVGVTDEFKNVIDTFKVEEGITPAGFRHELVMGDDGSLRVDLKRDIAFAENGKRRPGNMLFSANTANPFEIQTMKPFLANITTNPQIVYSQFLNNPKANVNGQFKNREEVMEELCRLIGPGCDISVEVNDPFAPFEKLLEEVQAFEQILTKYRLVVKVPHTGPLNKDNIDDYLAGNFPAVDRADSASAFYGHNLAYKFHELGYRVNFTLMSEPHQTALALLARPYFINAFVQRRTDMTTKMADLIGKLDATGDAQYRDQLHAAMLKGDVLASDDKDVFGAENKARQLLKYRNFFNAEGSDGLDSVRHSLRVIRDANLEDTRLIVCNTKTDQMYYDIDKLVTEPEFAAMKQKVVLTCEPEYFARFTGSPTIYNYQRSFLTSVTD